MSEQQSPGPLDKVSQKWRDFTERRRAYFAELFESGRWKLYFSEEEFLNRLREVVASSERWATIAPRPAERTESTTDAATAQVAALDAAFNKMATALDDQRTDDPRRSAA